MYNVSFPGLGIEFDVEPAAFTIGSFTVYWYGIIIGVGFLLALIFAMRNLERFGIDKDGFTDSVLVGLLCGIVGARAYYVIFRWEYYAGHLNEIAAIHNGGLAIYGGIIGGLLGGCLMARYKKISIPATLDIAVMGFLIGQGLGRWGNFFNQEAFGTATDLPWRMVSENTNGIGVHPCFLYESLWCLLGFVLLYAFSRRYRKYDGQIFLMYLVWYGFERMIVEGLRTDSLYTPIYGLRVSQVLAGLTLIAGIVLLIVFRNRTSKAVTEKGAAPDSEQDRTSEVPSAGGNAQKEAQPEKDLRDKNREIAPDGDEKAVPDGGKEAVADGGKEAVPDNGKEAVPDNGKETVPGGDGEAVPDNGKETVPGGDEEAVPDGGKEAVPGGDGENTPDGD